MKRMLLVGVLCLLAGHTAGTAQTVRKDGVDGVVGRLPCSMWTGAVNGSDIGKLFPVFANRNWSYGFVMGAMYASADRLTRVDALGVNNWMDAYCAENPSKRIEDAAIALVEMLKSATR